MGEKNKSMTTSGQLGTIATVLTIVFAALLVAAFFLPYASAVEEYRAVLGQLSENPLVLPTRSWRTYLSWSTCASTSTRHRRPLSRYTYRLRLRRRSSAPLHCSSRR